MRGRIRHDAVRLAVFLAVCLLGVFGLFAVFGQLRFGEDPSLQESKTYKAEFTNVTGLENGDFVRIAGVEVGKVKHSAQRGDALLRAPQITRHGAGALGQRDPHRCPCRPSVAGQLLRGHPDGARTSGLAWAAPVRGNLRGTLSGSRCTSPCLWS